MNKSHPELLQQGAGNLPRPDGPLWNFSTSCFLSCLGGVKTKIWIYFPKPQHSFGARVGKAKLRFHLHFASTESSAFFSFFFLHQCLITLCEMSHTKQHWGLEHVIYHGRRDHFFAKFTQELLWLRSWSLYMDRQPQQWRRIVYRSLRRKHSKTLRFSPCLENWCLGISSQVTSNPAFIFW